MPWVNKDQWTRTLGNRVEGFNKSGRSGNHVDPNPYRSYGGKLIPHTSVDVESLAPVTTDFPNAAAFLRPFADGMTSFAQRATNKSWEDFINKARSGSASLGEALGESREGLEMVASRFTQMARGYQHLRHGRFRAFLRVFGIGAKRKHRNLIRNLPEQASGLWLEYSFGWKPLVQDVYDACTALDRPLPGGKVQGKGYENRELHSRGWDSYSTYYFCAVYQGADVYVTNPFLFTLAAMGLANPVSVAWNLLPFSFLIDWVADVSSYLNSFTDLLGLKIVRPYTSIRIKTHGFVNNGWWKYPLDTQGYLFERVGALTRPSPNLHIFSNLGTSVTRAANAASLLVQVLSAPPRRDPGRLI